MAAAGGVAVWLLMGCASPGVPRPPSLHLPSQATRVEAQRVGEDVVVTWMTSTNTTDGATIKGQMTAAVCRENAPGVKAIAPGLVAGKIKEPACDLVRKMVVAPGPASVTDALPAELTAGAPRLLGYRVELMNDRGRSAGQPDAVFAAGGKAPPAVGPLTISARRGAAVIRWQAQSEGVGTTMELRRTLVATAAGPVAATVTAAVKRPVGGVKRSGATLLGAAKEPAGKVTLTVGRTGAADAGGVDPGGTVDRTVRDLDSYVYIAQRVRRVTLGGHELELRGVVSPPARFAFRDVFPPLAPMGLVSVPGGGFGTTASIDLSWEPNEEGDVTGYNVYRRDGDSEFVRLNAVPVPTAAYRDMTVKVGRAYTYRVTTVDQRRNESAASGEIHERLKP